MTSAESAADVRVRSTQVATFSETEATHRWGDGGGGGGSENKEAFFIPLSPCTSHWQPEPCTSAVSRSLLSFESNYEGGLSAAGENLHPGVCAGRP